MANQLPTEIWYSVFQNLCRSELCSTLRVSSLLHDVSIYFLFSSIRIYFADNAMSLSCRSSTEISREVLDHVKQNPYFAKVVKGIEVHAFADEDVWPDYGCLDALQFLPNLLSLKWLSEHARLSPGVAQNLATLCPQLQELYIPWHTTGMGEALRRIKGLRVLSSVYPLTRSETEPNCEFERLIEANNATLRVLKVRPSHVEHLPIQMLGHLRALSIIDLELDNDRKFTGFEEVFHHLPGLEALDLEGLLDTSVFTSLRHNTSMLPNLTSFRMCYPSEYTAERWDIVTDFIRGRISLRRLDIFVGRSPWTSVLQLLSVIQALPSLRVLGLYTGVNPLDRLKLLYLADNLPEKLEALRLEVHWNKVMMSAPDLEPVFRKLGKSSTLRYFHIHSAKDLMPVSPYSILTHMASLTKIGVGVEIWEIERTGADVRLMEWPWIKMRFMSAEDFGCVDEFWLVEQELLDPWDVRP